MSQRTVNLSKIRGLWPIAVKERSRSPRNKRDSQGRAEKMKTTGKKKKVADFATLFAKRLGQLEKEQFGDATTNEARKWLRKLIRVVRTFGFQRERIGLLIAEGEKHLRKERVWLRAKEAVAD